MGSVLGIKKASPETGLKSAAVGLPLCGEIFYEVEVGSSNWDFHIWRTPQATAGFAYTHWAQLAIEAS
ncbi:hypothetical protein SAMN05216369_0045 [Marinobacter antarcticus]|jgi:hypothetical protein|uniref:Uncharacterized protein n=1 Tax=Marinobacter antarcticus TaxID=564117 RepID=A0A1M6P2Q9_9GAMM|nr:hypothetical protein SAMN05216369_0045 [Marinobacter antarcticus]